MSTAPHPPATTASSWPCTLGALRLSTETPREDRGQQRGFSQGGQPNSERVPRNQSLGRGESEGGAVRGAQPWLHPPRSRPFLCGGRQSRPLCGALVSYPPPSFSPLLSHLLMDSALIERLLCARPWSLPLRGSQSKERNGHRGVGKC